MTAFRAAYADLKIVKTRGVCQVVLEIPLEQADAALEVLGGVPRPDREVWVGVARLAKDAAPAGPEPLLEMVDQINAETEAGEKKDRTPFHELPATQQAVLTCKDARFWRWVSEHDDYEATEEDARRYILDRCDVTSRAHLREPPAAIKFFQILTRYRKATGLDPWTPE